jgi:hypothetical protein
MKEPSYSMPVFTDLRMFPVTAGWVNVWIARKDAEFTHIMGRRFNERERAEEFAKAQCKKRAYMIHIKPHFPSKPI